MLVKTMVMMKTLVGPLVGVTEGTIKKDTQMPVAAAKAVGPPRRAQKENLKERPLSKEHRISKERKEIIKYT